MASLRVLIKNLFTGCSPLLDFQISIQSMYFPVTRHNFHVFASCFANNFYDFSCIFMYFQVDFTPILIFTIMP